MHDKVGMSIFNSDNEIGNILREAVKLKSAQVGCKRKTYETWPYFVQHTLFHGEKTDYLAWRALPFTEKMERSVKIKDEGNELYKQKNYADAVDKYEEAPSLFYYCYSTDPGWRKNNRGIDDDVLVLVDDQGSSDEDKAAVEKLRLTCCLNLSACKTKLGKFDESIVACNTAIELDENNVKALYRRAEALVKPTKSSAYDVDCAIKDLTKANQLDPEDKTIKTLLEHLKGERKTQTTKDKKTFAGMFERGTIYKKELEEAALALPKTKGGESELADLKKRIDNISDDDPIEKRIEDAELLRDLYMRNGKEDEARKLNEQIKEAKNALKEHREKQPEIDFSSPTPDMIKDAASYGLDLTDPMIQAELMRLEQCKGGQEGSDGTPPPPPPPAVPDFPPMETPEDLANAPQTDIPWKRYILLFGVPVAILRMWNFGLIARVGQLYWGVKAWRANFGASGDLEEVDWEVSSRTSMFARVYRYMSGAVDEDDF